MALLGRYERVRLLGRGAAGEVLLVRDRARGGQNVALKRIRALPVGHAEAEREGVIRAAFQREFATMASLSAPGVAEVYDFGFLPERADEPGGPFFTRAYVDGEPFDEAAERLDAAGRIALVVRLLDVMAPVHRVGITHGDLKPGNAIVDRQGRVHVIDFGLARVLGVGPRRAAEGGSPAFMAPELLSGEPPSIAADVFALGVLLWVTLIGRLPFADAPGGLLRMRMSGATPALPDGLDALTSAALQVAVRAMAADPFDRFPTVGELRAALIGLLPERPTAELTPFVTPRPRGHESLLSELDGYLAHADRAGEGTALVVRGAPGAGRSCLLRELKWQLQMARVTVLELSVASGFANGAAAALVGQVRALLGEDSAALATLRALEEEPVPAPAALADGLRAALLAAPDVERVVWLFDDLDAGDPRLAEVLRSLIHAPGAPTVSAIASCSDADTEAVRTLSASRVIELSALTPADVSALSTDVLGPVDTSVLEALFGVTHGLPGTLMEALLGLYALPAPTADDVRRLSLGGAGKALAQARLSRVPSALGPLLELLALVQSPVSQTVADVVLGAGNAAERAAWLEEGQLAGVLTAGADGFALADLGLVRAVVERLADARAERARALVAVLAGAGLPALSEARLWIATGDAAGIRAHVPALAEAVERRGDHRFAAELLSRVLDDGCGDPAGELRGALLRARVALGDHEGSAELAAELVAERALSPEMRAQAALSAARALTALARFDAAAAVLEEVPADADRDTRAQVACELSRVRMRTGDYEAAANAAEEGLAVAEETGPVRIELLCSRGLIAGYRGDERAAREHYREALTRAEQRGNPREQARARSYLAIGCWREARYEEARDLLIQSVSEARQAGDLALMANASMNLGAILFHLGDAAEAAERYEGARRLALRVGNVATGLQARTNLAHVHGYFGMYEQARAEVEALLHDGDAAGHRYVVAQAKAIQGDLSARTGDLEQALVDYDDAIARYQALGQKREQIVHHLHAAEALLDRAGPADGSAAAARLATARRLLSDHEDRELSLELRLLTARARIATGDAEAAVSELEAVIEAAEAGHDRDMAWRAHAAVHRAHTQLGTGFAGRKHLRAAVELLEEQAVRLPRAHRDAFWHDPRRRAVRQAAQDADDPSHQTNFDRGAVAVTMADPRTVRLLEIIKRLAAEHDLDRLLERITESAVDLSGAERGFVLLTDVDGQLETRTVRERPDAAQDASLAFSRSIAEAVLIDGEPIVTIDAAHDGRLQEYASVHQLMLRSVACLPIRTPERVQGVLYLEHRRSRGRFSEAVVDLLHAFADQAAIALNNARLHAENAARQHELEQANRALEQAKLDLEESLSARTQQLDEVRHELTRVRAARRGPTRHGMIGDSLAMRNVFGMIDRLRDASVPVVLQGESGTGKELVARAIHYGGVRAKQAFIAVNCGALPETLLESELFGHVRGAFSGADRERAGMITRASGGTLFLDEVSDMPPKMQIDLLRVLQEGTVCKLGGADEEHVDVRFIAAAQRPLEDLVAEGKFREDLFYRLNVVELRLPPLRERLEDVPALAEHFLAAMAERQGEAPKRLSRAALAWLARQPWPGNVRQLEHALLQASVLADADVIELAQLADGVPGSVVAPEDGPPVPAAASGDGHESLPPLGDSARVENLEQHREEEKRRILHALESHAWNRARAAKSLGMARRTFYRRLQDYQIL